MRLAPDDKFGPYTLISPLGEGGMGEVWKARDTRLDRTVALEVSKAAFSERFEREARAVAALNHPNICTLHDVGPNYLVMELVEGVPLKGPLPVEKAVDYAAQILDALDAAHHKGITHRDLKPANILIAKQGAKLLDFGLAKQSTALKETDATLTSALTGEGQILGTLQYMSPEQLQGKEADARSDIFGFGCVLYEMLTGQGYFPHWAANAKTLVFSEGNGPSGKLSLLRRQGDQRRVRYLDGTFAQPAFSPDGRWMAYASQESGHWEIFVQSVPAGHGKWQISTHGGAQPVWRQDGKELFYLSPESKIVAVPVKIGENFEAGVPKELFSVSTFGVRQARRNYSVSPDRQRFLVEQRVDIHPQTILLQNWLSAK